MNYSDQQKFFASYQTRWLVASSVILVLGSLSLREPTFATTAFLCLLGVSTLTLSYLPKYLHLHHEPDKRYRWAVRSRWILAVAAILLPATLQFTRLPVVLVAAGAAFWLTLVNGFVMSAFRNERVLAFRWLPLAYWIGDFWLIVALAYLGMDPFLLAGLIAVSLVFALTINVDLGPWFPLAGMSLAAALLRTAILPQAYGFNSAFLILEIALVAGTASWLTGFSVMQARRNFETTIADLSAFTGMDRAATEARLLRSRQMLVDAWKDAQLDENDKDALAQWYADNSLSYLFDIARFHLTYKHIVFSLDVLHLSRARCLDYGAGKGELALEMARRGMLVTYFDVPGRSREYAEWSAARQDLNLYFTSSKDEIDAQGLQFDTIVSLDVLEHMPDLSGELSFLSGRLAPGGRLIMTVPSGATESHPMHLAHDVRPVEFLAIRGLRDIKDWRLTLTGSEVLRKPDCVIMEKIP
jgi:2-polyprenyl-3-methyl-5-hydroxy-6-metoxy-1,4-benzoquinol methylase